MSKTEVESVHRQALEALMTGDMAAMERLFADDVVSWLLPGRSQLTANAGKQSGFLERKLKYDRRQREEVLGFLERSVKLCGGSFSLDLVDTGYSDIGAVQSNRLAKDPPKGRLKKVLRLLTKFFDLFGDEESLIWIVEDGRVVHLRYSPESIPTS